MAKINATVKHTPGPWRYDKVTYGQDLTYHIQTVDMSHRNTFIGEAGGGLQFNSEITANAKLIAAAPELLDTLIYVTKMLGGLVHDQDHPANIAYHAALKAIKKATE